MKAKVFTYEDGDNVAVVIPAQGVTIEQAILHPSMPANVTGAIVDLDKLPDRYFREAWEFDPKQGAKVNIEKAKEIQRNLWRSLREPKLAELDVIFMQALEEGDTAKQKAIKNKKNALRDVTLTELPDDLAAIKNTIPEALG